MGEELNEHEERLYAMNHHVDETQNNLSDSQQNKLDLIKLIENGPRSTMRRYWRPGPDIHPNPYQKINTVKDPAPQSIIQSIPAAENTTPKQEKSPPKPPSPVDLSIFQSPVPQNAKKIIEFLEYEGEKPVVLESSDEDEVVEVALPPKPTITIDSSDEDELQIIKTKSPTKLDPKCNPGERAVSASPVPSVVSSVSDEFIRGDCIALNISSRHPDKHSFDFSLHGSDLLGQTTSTSSKKRKRKKNKEALTSTPINDISKKPANAADACFATPKSMAKNKKQRINLFEGKSALRPDLYDSDSNMSTADANKNNNPYIVTEKSLPSTDVYESDSNQSEKVKEVNTDQSKDKYVIETSSDSDIIQIEYPKNNSLQPDSDAETIKLSAFDDDIMINDNTFISDSIVIGNVTGLSASIREENSTPPSKDDISKYVSSKEPSILNEDLDFDNLKGKEKISKKRRYSLTTLRAEMEKFYNESWGGEDFNHKEIQKNMSRDKSLWVIDPKDRMQSLVQRKLQCNYCNRYGHRDDTCRQKPPVCYMCGNTGHFETRCPTKICVNCGAPNFMYSTMCRNCSGWEKVRCAECGQNGHPASHCPDLWRRYHNTTSMDTALDQCTTTKKNYQLFCSGCARRGHLINTCRVTLPFSGLPINSPYVKVYRPVLVKNYPAMTIGSKTIPEEPSPRRDPRNQNNKRISKSPSVYETHENKRRNLSADDRETTKGPAMQKIKQPPKEVILNNTMSNNKRKSLDSSISVSGKSLKVPESTASKSSNHDNKGRVIQDNEVSATSDMVSSARVYITNDMTTKLKTKEGKDWLEATMKKLKVEVLPSEVSSFLAINGKVADQERFQTELREWVQANTSTPKIFKMDLNEAELKSIFNSLPKNRNNLIRKLTKGIDLLKEDLGDPWALYKELTFSQMQHEKLRLQKVISPEKLSNSRTHINDTLKKLNIILLGQTGLAGGKDHVYELINYQQTLMNSRSKHISLNVRTTIGMHYNTIFAPVQRNDYIKLLEEYNASVLQKSAATKSISSPVSKIAKKKRKRKPIYLKARAPSFKPSIPSQESQVVAIPANNVESPPMTGSNVSPNANHFVPNLLTFRSRLNSAKNSGMPPGSRGELTMLQRRIQQYISVLSQNKKVSSKSIKKINNLREHVHKFLSKVN